VSEVVVDRTLPRTSPEPPCSSSIFLTR
jgi:hypothetical protein